jgi:DNA (cytosine-5)-methyltransferase 1
MEAAAGGGMSIAPLTDAEMIVDNFAGGGGASTGITMAIGRHPDVAINHSPEAVALHRANHPGTEHLCQSVWKADPADVVGRRKVGLAWFSPDCKHFSKAKGGAPVKRNIRDLAWVVVLWAKTVKPRVLMLENVEEFQTWGPLGEDGRPCPARSGTTFRHWVRELKRLGYAVEWRELRACDYGAPTIRKRLFVIARCDGAPIVWPAPTHGPGLPLPWRTAAECIDWSIPVPSIFERRRELAEATQRRIAHGIRRYCVDAANPYIVSLTHQGEGFRGQGIDDPFATVTAANRGEKALVVPVMGYAQQGGATRPADAPLHTITASRKDQNQVVTAVLASVAHADVSPAGVRRWGKGYRDIRDPMTSVLAGGGTTALVAATLATLRNNATGDDLERPLRTITAGGEHHALVAAFMAQHNGNGVIGRALDDPMATVTTSGSQQQPVTVTLSHEDQARAERVTAFLIKFYGTAIGQDLAEPLHTATTKARFGLITVKGIPIVDIGMRMLSPRELFNAQGFRADYRIEMGLGPDGEPVPLTKTAQIRCCGNSVCPPVAAAIAAANLGREAFISTEIVAA